MQKTTWSNLSYREVQKELANLRSSDKNDKKQTTSTFVEQYKNK